MSWKGPGRRRVAGMVSALIAALVMATIGFGWAAASPAVGQHRLKALEPFAEGSDTYIDLGDPGVSQGDLDTFHFEVYDSTGTVHLGFETAECVVGFVYPDGNYTFDCSSDFVLTHGQIETKGHVDPAPGLSAKQLFIAPTGEQLSEHFAIMGGTARYRGAEGQLDWGGDNPDAIVLVFNFDD
jgi:hypothetical protein